MSTLDNFRKEAKRWLQALRAGDPAARERLRRVYPNARPEAGLREVQHALAREHGHESWVALKDTLRQAQALRQAQGGAGLSVDGSPAGDDREALRAVSGGRTHEERVANFLSFACWDTHTHGKGDHRMHDRAAQRFLAQHPEIARDSLYTAIVSGDLEEVTRILAERPEAAREPGGSRGWTPILYLAFTRFTHQPTIDNAVAIARLLLDNGANPNDYYMAGDARYTVLVGVAGEGEQDSPRQPQAAGLFQLLLDRGAKPFDIQVLYNTHFSGDMIWWLDLVYAHTRKTNQAAAWDDPNWSMLDMGGYGPGAYFTLRVAVHKNDLELARWLLSHGASPNALTSRHPKFKPKTTLYQDAQLLGFTEMCELLIRNGATPTPYLLSDREQFIEACFRMDRDEIHAHLRKHPEYLTAPDAISAAAEKDRADVVALLLDLGTPIEVENAQKQRPLHHAAGNDALRVARLLIERGAEVDPVETAYGGTPIGWASYGDKREMIRLLSRYSRNVWTLVWVGDVHRLRELLHEKPERARLVAEDGTTPLWWLPDDETQALEIVELLVSHGADPSLRNKAGRTAADWALNRGMLEIARKLGASNATLLSAPPPAPSSPDVQRYERLAQDLLFAFESGHAGAIARLQKHNETTITWDSLRASVRQRLDAISESEKPDGYFALPHAKLLVARQAGYSSWAELEKSLETRS